MVNGRQKQPGHADVIESIRKIFGEGEIIGGERVYTVGSGENEVPALFLFKYTGRTYKPGDIVPESVVREAIGLYRARKNPKDLEKELKKDIAEIRKADTLGAGTLKVEAGGQVGIPAKVEDRAKGTEKGAHIAFERREKYGKTWGGEVSYTSAGAYGGTISYADLIFSAATDKWKFGMGGPLEFGLMSGDIEDVVLMKGLERAWNLKVDWKKTGAWVRPYFGLNYGPWYFLYNPVTRGFYGGFSIWGGIIGYAQTAFQKGMNECEGCGSGKKVLAGLGELIGLSSGIREGRRAWKRSKGNFFQRFFYSASHFFKGMFASIGYVGLQVGLVQPWRLFVNSLYRFVFRAKTPKDAKTREFTPKEISKMKEKLERELGEGLVDKAKDDVEMWLKYEKLPPAFRGYLMAMKDRIDIMGAYVGLPFTLFPPGWKKSTVKKEIEERTRKAIAEIKEGKNVMQNVVYLEAKLAGIKKETSAGREIFEEFSPCVLPKDDIAKAVGDGFNKLTTQFNSWATEIKNGNYKNAYLFALSSDMINGFLASEPNGPSIPPEYSYLMNDTPIKEIGEEVFQKAGYYATKQKVGEGVDNETDLGSILGAYAIANSSRVFSGDEAEEEKDYINRLVNQDQKMSVHLFSKIMNNIEIAANKWRKAMEERNVNEANGYAGQLAYYGMIAEEIVSSLPKKVANRLLEENKEKISYLALIRRDIPIYLLLEYHPEFAKAVSGIETADVKQMKESLKQYLDDIKAAVDAGNHTKATEIWDGIDEYIKNIDPEKANQLENLLSKERWSEDDRKNIKSLLRFFRTNV